MALPVFSKTGVASVTLSNASLYPHVMPKVLSRFVAISDANTVQVVKVGPPLSTIVLSFDQLTRVDRDALEVFFADPLVEYGGETFQYTDNLGIVYNVKYLEPQFALPEVSDDLVRFEMVLTVV